MTLSQLAADLHQLAVRGDVDVFHPRTQIRFEDFEVLFAGVEVTHSPSPTGDHYSVTLSGGTEIHCFHPKLRPSEAPRKVTM